MGEIYQNDTGTVMGKINSCYYLVDTAAGGINGKDSGDYYNNTSVIAASYFASENMAELLNANQEDGPWEYIIGKPAPTLKVFNKG